MMHRVLLTKTAKINLDYLHPAIYPHAIVAMLSMRRGEEGSGGQKLVGPYETIYLLEREHFSIVYMYVNHVIYVMSIFMR